MNKALIHQIGSQIEALSPRLIERINKAYSRVGDFTAAQENQDITTTTDLELGHLVKEHLEKKFDLVVDSEEFPVKGPQSKPVVRIDPIDGTKHFALGIDLFSIAISLSFENKVLFGIVINPQSRKIYTAYLDEGAKLNNRPIQVNKHPLSKSFVFYEQPYMSGAKVPDNYFGLINSLVKDSFRLRNIGNSSLSIAYVAQGASSVFVNLSSSTKLYDIEAACLVASEAGAIIKDLSGNKIQLSAEITTGEKKTIEKPMIIGNPKAVAEVVKLIKGIG